MLKYRMSPISISPEALAGPILDTPAFRLAAFREAASLSRDAFGVGEPALECMAYFWTFETDAPERAWLSRLHPSIAASILLDRLPTSVGPSAPYVPAGSSASYAMECLAPSFASTRRAQRSLTSFLALSHLDGIEKKQFLLEAPWIRAEPFDAALPAWSRQPRHQWIAKARTAGLLAFFSSLAVGGFLGLAAGSAFAVAGSAGLAYAWGSSWLLARQRVAGTLALVRQAYPANAQLGALDPNAPGAVAKAVEAARQIPGSLSDGEIEAASELDMLLRHHGPIAWPMRHLAAFEESQAIRDAIDSEIGEAPAAPPRPARRL
jgi:hypothetical protein